MKKTIFLFTPFLCSLPNTFAQDSKEVGPFGLDFNTSISRKAFSIVPTIYYRTTRHKIEFGAGPSFFDTQHWIYRPFNYLELNLGYKFFPFQTLGRFSPYFMVDLKHLILQKKYMHPAYQKLHNQSHYVGGGLEMKLTKRLYFQGDFGIGKVLGYGHLKDDSHSIFLSHPGLDVQGRFGLGFRF